MTGCGENKSINWFGLTELITVKIDRQCTRFQFSDVLVHASNYHSQSAGTQRLFSFRIIMITGKKLSHTVCGAFKHVQKSSHGMNRRVAEAVTFGETLDIFVRSSQII